MSTLHGPVVIKPIDEVARYQKNLIPASIPEDYSLKPMFKSVADESSIRNGIVAFRDFLYLFCDCLISDGQTYTIAPKKPTGIADYPFLFNITNLLVDIGYHGKLSDSGTSLMVTQLPVCTASIEDNGKKVQPKISASKMLECLRFLSLCGFEFSGIDLDARTFNISTMQQIEVFYQDNPILLTGLKALSIADMELRIGRRYWNDNNLLRCDYRLLKTEESDMRDVLIDFLYPLPEKVREFALQLHQRYIQMGLTCINTRLGLVSFAYAYVKESGRSISERDIYSKRVWEFSYSLKDGYCLFVRPKKTEKYADAIKVFDISLQKKIAQGYGCDRKRNKPCQHGCQGILIPLDESILKINKDIEIWLDNEIPEFKPS
jgi:hypothetical protein